jgi:capsular exopolysaccharide synthesis family protein
MQNGIENSSAPVPAGSGQVTTAFNQAVGTVAGQIPPGYGPAFDYGAEPSLDILHYLRIALKRRWLILGIASSVLVVGLLVTLMMTPYYTATVRLQIERNAAKIVEGASVTPIEVGEDTEFLTTQHKLLQSRSMSERVVSTLKLAGDDTFVEQRQFSPLHSLKSILVPDVEDAAASNRERVATDILARNLTVAPIRGSRLVEVSYADPDPRVAQRVITAYADAFIAANLDKRFEANAYAKTFLEDQLKQLKLRLETSEQTLLDFAQKEQIVSVTEKASIAEINLTTANEALSKLISERIKNEELWKQVASGTATNLPQILSNKPIEELRESRNKLATLYQERLETFKPDYPAMKQLELKIAEIDRQIASETGAIKESLKAAYENSVSQEQEMQKRIETLRAEVLDFQKRSIQYNILKREVDTNRSLYEGLLQRYKEIDVAGGAGANNVFIVDKATLPRSPSSPKIPLNLALALFLGLGAGLGAAFLLEFVDDTFRTAEDLERASGLVTLGIVPKVLKPEDLEAEFADPRSAMSEAYRSLCTAMQFSTARGLPKTIAITSAVPSEGKSLTSVAIGRHFATMGLKVLLVDADMRNPSLHHKLGCDHTVGLSNYLTGACRPPDAFQQTAYPNLAFMSAGPLPPNAADLLAGPRLLSLLSIGSEVFDLIILDGPPVMGLADAMLLSNAVEATVVIVAAGQTRVGLVSEALKRLSHARGKVIGAVLTKYDAKSAGYGYGYGYDYGGANYGAQNNPLPSTDRQRLQMR